MLVRLFIAKILKNICCILQIKQTFCTLREYMKANNWKQYLLKIKIETHEIEIYLPNQNLPTNLQLYGS